LEPHSQTNDTPNSRRVFEAQLRECFGRVVYSHKTHEKCADILLTRLSRIKLAQIVLAALSTAGFIPTIFGSAHAQVAAIVGGLFSVVLLTLNAYTKNYDLGELAQKHRQAAADLWLVRELYLSLITDLAMGEKPIETLQATRDTLLGELHKAYAAAPGTTNQAYRAAQKALKFKEDMTFADEEIDAFLPRELRRGKD
jgi:hypothetical protein